MGKFHTPSPSVTDGEMVTLAELSRAWRMDRKTVRRLLDDAGVPCYVLCAKRNGSIRYAKAEVQRFLQRCADQKKAASS